MVQTERRGNVVVITLHHPPVNALTRALVEAIHPVLDTLASDESLEKIVFTGSGKFFIAGADIREIERITRREAPPDLSYLNALLDKIERFPKPVVMALNGAALGIGLEFALAGHYRIASETATFALPEVKLGLIPGAGGTQRLPRLTGLARALALIESGTTLNATEALDAGILNDVVPPEELLHLAIRSVTPIRRTSELPLPSSRATAALLAAYTAGTFEAGLAAETQLFEAALLSSEARAQVYLFFAERDALRLPAQLPSGQHPPTVIPTPHGRAAELVYDDSTDPELLRQAHQQLRAARQLPILVREPIGKRLEDLVESGDSRVLLDTAEALLASGTIQRLSDIDVLFVFGYGFPAPQGGPIFSSR